MCKRMYNVHTCTYCVPFATHAGGQHFPSSAAAHCIAVLFVRAIASAVWVRLPAVCFLSHYLTFRSRGTTQERKSTVHKVDPYVG